MTNPASLPLCTEPHRQQVDRWAALYADWYARNSLKTVPQLQGWKECMHPLWDNEPVLISPLDAFVVFDTEEDIPFSVYSELRGNQSRDIIIEGYLLCIQDRRILSGIVMPIRVDELDVLVAQHLESKQNGGQRSNKKRRLGLSKHGDQD